MRIGSFIEERTLSQPILILPGIGNSGPEHWQSLWEASDPAFTRIRQRDWDNPDCEEWVACLEVAASHAGPDAIVVAHSLGCLVVASWAARRHAPIGGALLVAVPDPSGANFPKEATGFSQTPTRPFAFRSTLVISADDPYGSPPHAKSLARVWGSSVFEIGNRGHINANSGLGHWPEGFALLRQLRAG